MASEANVSYSVHLCPPDYPRQLHPFRCAHDPIYQMCAAAWTDRIGGKSVYVIDSPICMACGKPLPGTYGGNVFGCLSSCYAVVGSNAEIGLHIRYLIDRYLRIAARLFDESGWTGRHRKWAELIDPKLSMRVAGDGRHSDGTRFFRVKIDDSYFAPDRIEEEPEKPEQPDEPDAQGSLF